MEPEAGVVYAKGYYDMACPECGFVVSTTGPPPTSLTDATPLVIQRLRLYYDDHLEAVH